MDLDRKKYILKCIHLKTAHKRSDIERNWVIFEKFYFDKYSKNEIAKEFNISSQRVEQIYAKVLSTTRRYLRENTIKKEN